MTTNVTQTELNLRGISYILLGVAGPWVFVNPPETFPGEWSFAVAVIWGTLLIPSFVAGIASFFGRYRVEMIALPLVACALLVYAISIFYLVPTIPSHGAHGFVLLSFVALLASRFVNTMKLAQTSPTTSEIPIVEKE